MDYVTRGVTLAGASALGYLGSFNVIVATAMPDVMDAPITQFLEKGGMAAVLLVVLWVYRRDWKRLNENEAERTNKVLEVADRQAAASQAVAVSLAAHTEVLREIKDEIKDRRR